MDVDEQGWKCYSASRRQERLTVLMWHKSGSKKKTLKIEDWTNRQMNRWTDRQMGRQTERWTDGKTNSWKSGQTDGSLWVEQAIVKKNRWKVWRKQDKTKNIQDL